MTYDLTGKRAIVTGASRGLGAAIAESLGNSGVRLFLPSRRYFDLRNYGSEERIISRFREQEPALDVLVNCAGVQGPVGNCEETDSLDYINCLQVNLISSVLLCRLAVRWMRDTNTAGSIINISGGGACNPRTGYSAYATSKAGLVRFSETIAEECKPYGIRVNCVAPGLLNTRMGSPEGADPRHAAELVTWLASDASRPITGKLISAVHDPWPNLERVLAKDPDMYTLRRVVP